MTVADVIGDGKPDVTIASGSFGAVKVSVFLGSGDGTFQQDRVVSSFVGIHAVASADPNGDDKPDLAYTTRSAADGFAPMVVVALGLGDGTFATPTQFAVGDSYSCRLPMWLAMALLISSPAASPCSLGDGKGGFRRRDYWEDTASNIILADFDGDGDTDIVIAFGDAQAITGPAIAVFLNGDGSFSGASISVIPNLAQANNDIYNIAAANSNAANLSHDGIRDLLRSNQ